MASRRSAGIIALGLMLVAAGAVGYVLWRPAKAAPIVGIVRGTEVRVAPASLPPSTSRKVPACVPATPSPGCPRSS